MPTADEPNGFVICYDRLGVTLPGVTHGSLQGNAIFCLSGRIQLKSDDVQALILSRDDSIAQRLLMTDGDLEAKSVTGTL